MFFWEKWEKLRFFSFLALLGIKLRPTWVWFQAMKINILDTKSFFFCHRSASACNVNMLHHLPCQNIHIGPKSWAYKGVICNYSDFKVRIGKNAISLIFFKKTEKVPQILFILYFYIILFNCNHLEPGGRGGNGFYWNALIIYILADFNKKNLPISKIHPLVNHPWPVT